MIRADLNTALTMAVGKCLFGLARVTVVCPTHVRCNLLAEATLDICAKLSVEWEYSTVRKAIFINNLASSIAFVNHPDQLHGINNDIIILDETLSQENVRDVLRYTRRDNLISVTPRVYYA